jgi:hypothetical protein
VTLQGLVRGQRVAPSSRVFRNGFFWGFLDGIWEGYHENGEFCKKKLREFEARDSMRKRNGMGQENFTR